jgi:hypothetical protein
MPVETKEHNQLKIQHVEMCDIVKRFPGVMANNKVCFEVKAGESTRCWVRTAPERAH